MLERPLAAKFFCGHARRTARALSRQADLPKRPAVRQSSSFKPFVLSVKSEAKEVEAHSGLNDRPFDFAARSLS